MLRHAKYEGAPVRYITGDNGLAIAGWACWDGVWHPATTSEINHEAGVLTATSGAGWQERRWLAQTFSPPSPDQGPALPSSDNRTNFESMMV